MAATLRAKLQLELTEKVGEQPVVDPLVSLELAGFTNYRAKGAIELAPSAADVPITFTNAAVVIVWSIDKPFKDRRAGGETLSGSKMLLVAWGEKETDATWATSVLLSDAGTTGCNLRYIVMETVTS